MTQELSSVIKNFARDAESLPSPILFRGCAFAMPSADGIAKAHPLKRIGEGKDSASLAKFLITEDSSWVTGL